MSIRVILLLYLFLRFEDSIFKKKYKVYYNISLVSIIYMIFQNFKVSGCNNLTSFTGST